MQSSISGQPAKRRSSSDPDPQLARGWVLTFRGGFRVQGTSEEFLEYQSVIG
jgi:hypothetical protein